MVKRKIKKLKKKIFHSGPLFALKGEKKEELDCLFRKLEENIGKIQHLLTGKYDTEDHEEKDRAKRNLFK